MNSFISLIADTPFHPYLSAPHALYTASVLAPHYDNPYGFALAVAFYGNGGGTLTRWAIGSGALPWLDNPINGAVCFAAALLVWCRIAGTHTAKSWRSIAAVEEWQKIRSQASNMALARAAGLPTYAVIVIGIICSIGGHCLQSMVSWSPTLNPNWAELRKPSRMGLQAGILTALILAAVPLGSPAHGITVTLMVTYLALCRVTGDTNPYLIRVVFDSIAPLLKRGEDDGHKQD